jgi:hypothetical protein
MKRLISMTDFVLDYASVLAVVDNFKDLSKVTNSIFNYANFLKQPLKLSLFVPCDEYDNVLEEPEYSVVNYGFSSIGIDFFEKEKLQYQQALSRVIFEGFDVKDGLTVCDENSILHIFWNYEGKWVLSKGLKTIEDLVKFNLELKDGNKIF